MNKTNQMFLNCIITYFWILGFRYNSFLRFFNYANQTNLYNTQTKRDCPIILGQPLSKNSFKLFITYKDFNDFDF